MEWFLGSWPGSIRFMQWDAMCWGMTGTNRWILYWCKESLGDAKYPYRIWGSMFWVDTQDASARFGHSPKTFGEGQPSLDSWTETRIGRRSCEGMAWLVPTRHWAIMLAKRPGRSIWFYYSLSLLPCFRSEDNLSEQWNQIDTIFNWKEA